ncbi:MAG: hypothetical protein HZB38_08410 [Planctomycetes bacterium]|nr:hypothetical protein [Planctomycetota bacterium]
MTARFTRDWTDSRRRIKPAELLAESVPDATKDRASVALQQMARERRNLPSDSALLLEAQRNQPLDDEVATVALLGVDRMPVIRNVVFEPYILSQSQRFGTRWLWVGVGALLFILNAHVAATSAWSSPASTAVRPTNVAPLFFLVVLGSALVLGAIIWFVGVLLEPEYVRILPGEIQYVRFSAGARGRLDRAYPMTAGTTAILREEFGRITLTLLRGGQRDVLNISALWDQYTALERIWQSLLTTAPTPALTDKELLG